MGFDAQHVTEIDLDGVYVAGIESMKQEVSNAQVTMGPGSSNWVPHGENVRVNGASRGHSLPDCSSRFAPFPRQG